MRQPRELVDVVFMRLNEASGGHYTPEQFSFRWPKAAANADPITDEKVRAIYVRLLADVRAAEEAREQYRRIAEAGRRAKSALERVAWGRAWRSVCSFLFVGDRNAHRTPPHGVEWYCP